MARIMDSQTIDHIDTISDGRCLPLEFNLKLWGHALNVGVNHLFGHVPESLCASLSL